MSESVEPVEGQEGASVAGAEQTIQTQQLYQILPGRIIQQTNQHWTLTEQIAKLL